MVSKRGNGGVLDDLGGRSSKVSKYGCGDVGGVGRVPLVLKLVIEVMSLLMVDLVPKMMWDH